VYLSTPSFKIATVIAKAWKRVKRLSFKFHDVKQLANWLCLIIYLRPPRSILSKFTKKPLENDSVVFLHNKGHWFWRRVWSGISSTIHRSCWAHNVCCFIQDSHILLEDFYLTLLVSQSFFGFEFYMRSIFWWSWIHCGFSSCDLEEKRMPIYHLSLLLRWLSEVLQQTNLISMSSIATF